MLLFLMDEIHNLEMNLDSKKISLSDAEAVTKNLNLSIDSFKLCFGYSITFSYPRKSKCGYYLISLEDSTGKEIYHNKIFIND